MLFFKNTSNRIMNKKGKSMISKEMGKNKVGLRSLLAKFMVLMMIVNILNVIHPAAVRAEEAEHLNNPNLIIQSPRVENSFSVREYLKNNSIQNSKENLVTIDCDFELKEIVSHKEFGIGIITEITPKSITVKFSEGAKKFPSKIANKFLKKELKL